MVFQIKRKEVARPQNPADIVLTEAPLSTSQQPLIGLYAKSSPPTQTSPVSHLESSSEVGVEHIDVSNTAQTSGYAIPSVLARDIPILPGADSSAPGQKLYPAVSAIPSDAPTLSESSELIPATSEKQKTTHTQAIHVVHDWLWEILAALFSILCLTCICVLLAFYDGKPTPDILWGITLNAIVALLATVMKGALLAVIAEVTSQLKWLAFSGHRKRPLTEFDTYDNASRGGVGSMMFIWHHRKKFWHDIVFLAAIFGILSIGISAFSQQLIRTNLRPVQIPSNYSSIARNTYYNQYYQNLDNRDLPVPERLDPDMSAAVYSGFFGSTIANSDLVRCETENCTYPITPTLAVCSKCIDISSQIRYTNTTRCPNGCWTLPNGPGLESMDLMRVNATANASQTLVFKDVDSLIVAFRYINGSSTKEGNAAECALYFCVQAYNTTMTRGNISQVIIQTWSDVTDHYVPRVADWHYMGTQGYPILQIAVANNTAYNRYGELYRVSDKALWALNSLLPSRFTGNVMSGTHGTASGLYMSQDTVERLYYASPGIPDLANRMAESMTASVRRSANKQVVMGYSGTSLQSLPTVSIVWPWVVLPASIVLFANFFLCYGMIRTVAASRSSEIRVWKSSQLPMLYHGLDVQDLQSSRENGDNKSLLTVKEMQSHAKGMFVSMRNGGDGLKLSTA